MAVLGVKHAKSAILAALKIAAQSEAEAVMFLEQQRWGAAPACPRCGDANVYRMIGRDGQRNLDYRWRCRGCRQFFTVRTNTVFEETRLPLRVWVYAFWRACASKKGISALQLSRELEITHKSALFVLRRIRHGMGASEHQDPKLLTGTVEVDEPYVGGKPRFWNNSRETRVTEKAPVVAMAQRGGDVRFRAVERVTAATIGYALAENASITARLLTDESTVYPVVGRDFLGGHHTVTHSKKEYVRVGTDVHTNTVESVFSLLKRGVYGTFHSVSKKHLPNYLNEFEFRHNTRKMDDASRISRAIRRVDGKRLTYRESVDNPPYAPAVVGQARAPFEWEGK
jgi:transposase-like protein